MFGYARIPIPRARGAGCTIVLGPYRQFSHYSGLSREREGMDIARSAMRRILVGAGVKVELIEGLDRLAGHRARGWYHSRPEYSGSSEYPVGCQRTLFTYTAGPLQSGHMLGGSPVSLDKDRAEGIGRDTVYLERKKPTPLQWEPTSKQVASWEAVHAAKRKRLSIKGITRESRIRRITVEKHPKADGPPDHALSEEGERNVV